MVDLLSACGYLMNGMSHASPLPFAGILQGIWGFGLAEAFLHCRAPLSLCPLSALHDAA